MGRELQKKKNKSSISKVRHKPKSKKVPIKGNAVVARNWNHKETLTQNYRRLGLVSKLNSRSGGTELLPKHLAAKKDGNGKRKDGLEIRPQKTEGLGLGSVKVVRDEGTGGIVSVVREEGEEDEGVRRWGGRELRDPLSVADDGDEDDDHDVGGRQQHDIIRSMRMPMEGEQGAVIKELVRQAENAAPRKKRKQSRREEEWVERLVEKWGEDLGGMARDRKLNPMQQSEGDIGRRVRAWREGRRREVEGA
ncbi:MAG: hypothetical protein Q9183_000746 [Haloplaca sp. 2 TL-2023]